MLNMEDSLPPGFRFHPTDEELVAYYLTHKVTDSAFFAKAIAVVDLNRCEPWDLPGKAVMGEREWYFFSLRDRKYPTGLRTNRATEAGYWKTTGKDKEILTSGVLVGMKKTLVFYKGRAPKGEKSNWVMHEYRLSTAKFPSKIPKEEWVVCRVFRKSDSIGRRAPILPSLQQSPSNGTHLTLDQGEIESLDQSDYYTESNLELSEITRLLGNSDTSNIDQNSIDNTISNLISTSNAMKNVYVNVDTGVGFLGEKGMHNTLSSLTGSSFINLNFPSSNSNIFRSLQMSVANNYRQEQGQTSSYFNPFTLSNSNFVKHAPTDLESLWHGN